MYRALVVLSVSLAVSQTAYPANGYEHAAAGGNDQVRGLIILPTTQKYVLTGWSNTTVQNPTTAQFTNAGALDTSFNHTGYNVQTVGSGNSTTVASALQSDGKIVVVGLTEEKCHFTPCHFDGLVMRFTTAGALDASFNTGKVITPVGSGVTGFNAVTLQSDGKIVAVGATNGYGPNEWVLARYTTAGKLDATFGSSGIAAVGAPSIPVPAAATAVTMLGTKILVLGYAATPHGYQWALARFNANGSLDSTFGSGGVVLNQISYAGANDTPSGMALKSDGSIVGVGQAGSVVNPELVVVHYNSDGTLDLSFGAGGVATLSFAGNATVGTAATIQSDGKIVVSGWTSYNCPGDQGLVARFNTDGTFDTTGFGSGLGYVLLNPSGNGTQTFGIGLQSDGKIVAGGNGAFSGRSDDLIIRLNTDGSYDSTF
jgi:uncharacterized delta-60 repeat protein